LYEAKIDPLRSSRRATWVRRGAAASAFAAVAAAAFLWVPTGITGDDGIRTKGSAHVGFFVEHAGRVRRGFPGEKVEPGDKLQLVVATHEAAHVAVVSIDGAQKPNVYYASNRRVGPTIGEAEEPLPVSILLDDVLGNELLWGLVCKRAQDEAELLRILRRDGARFSHPEDCVQTAWTITKVARSP